MSYLSIRDLDLKGKRVFIRVDFNVPLQKNDQGVMEITSDKRIKASLPTIQYALAQGAGLNRTKGWQPIRAAVTGSNVSPPLPESLELLGRERTVARIRAAAR